MLSPGARLYPLLSAVPMGWTCALYLAQRVHEEILTRSPDLCDVPCAVDFRLAPRPSDGAFYVFALRGQHPGGGQRRGRSEPRTTRSLGDVHQGGLDVHEETDASREMLMLGGFQEGDPPRCGLGPKRFWKLYAGLGHLANRRRVATSREVSRASSRPLHVRSALSPGDVVSLSSYI